MFPAWLIWALLAFFSYGTWAIFSKWIGNDVAPVPTQVISTLGMLPIIVSLAVWRKPRNPGAWRRGTLAAFLGGAVSCAGNIPFFGALGEAKAADVVPITALYPVVTVVLAVLILRERLLLVHVAGIGLCLVSIYLLKVSNDDVEASDDPGLVSPLLLLALIPVVLWGIAGFLQKLSTYDISANASAAWFLAAFVPVGLILFVWQPPSSDMAWPLWVKASMLGFLLAFGNYAVTVAYAKNGKASVITPLVGLYPLVSIPAAMWFFDEKIGWREALGAGLALVSIVALSYEPAPPQSIQPSTEEVHP
jgi:uncharacterized membrane protein